MVSGLRRYEFSERLAEILGESRRDLRFRVTLMVMGGLVAPGPRGRGSPPATAQYAANLLIGAMAAPQQAHTVEAIRCYRALQPTVVTAGAAAPRIVLGPPATRSEIEEPPAPSLLFGQLPFGETLTRLLALAKATETRATLARELFGVWVSRGFPAAGVQLGGWSKGQRIIITQRYELPEGVRPPAWLDPDRGGLAEPGLFHTVSLPVRKLIEIGTLTTFSDERRPRMLNLGPKMATIANLANLARQGRHRRQWEKVLSALASVQAWSDTIDTRESRLVEVTGFGSNPGNLRMLTYVPDVLSASPALVVVLHGCTQTAASYDKGTGWSTLAERLGFALLLPEQHWRNNPLRCFNWFRTEDTERDSGEPLSVRQMIERMIADHGIDRRRIYVTGLSSGGAMTSVMLATYPDVFAGGAILSGVPYRTAIGLQEAFESMFQGRSRSEREWGDLVRSASPHQGPWPKVSVWHGDADSSVKPMNADEIIKQWADVHGLDPVPTIEKTVNGYPHRVWHGPGGEVLIESYTITGMTHGAPLDLGGEEHPCGTAAPFFHDVGISSTYQIARFWGLPETRPEAAATAHRSWRVTPTPEPAYARARPSSEKMPTIYVDSAGRAHTADVFSAKESAPDRGAERFGSDQQGLDVDVHGIITKSLEAAGLLKGSRGDPSDAPTAGGPPFGVDVHGIITKSLEAAGLLKGSQEVPLDSTADNRGLAGSGWEGEGWELLADDPRAFRDGPLLFGHASSGIGCDVGNKVRSVSRQLSLGHRPELSYVRRLSLGAAVNDYTSARFSVLVDGVLVDEVTAVGMDHTEAEWMQRSGIDLAPFADRTVTLTFEVAANSNVCNEVFAKAWVDRITVRHAAAVAEL